MIANHFIGKNIRELPTPSLVVDLDNLTANLEHMQQLVSGYGKALRPHVKTHKCSRLAKMQIEAGATGITCATIGEAEAMAAAGIEDILIANQLVTFDKMERVARLLQQAQVKFVVDSPYGIQAAAQSALSLGCIFEVLVEVDIGGRRCGAQTPQETLELARQVSDCPQLRFGGLQAYNGGSNYILDLDERERRCRLSDEILQASVAAVRPHFDLPSLSGAGTGNAPFLLQCGTLTEIQAGSYVYSDITYRQLAPLYQPALYVLSTVLSHPASSWLVMDAGLKSMGTEFGKPEAMGYPDLELEHYSEEHLQWKINGPAPQLGEKVLFIPSHCCTTVNHYRRCYVARADQVMDCWEIDAF